MKNNREKSNIIFIHVESMDGRKMGCRGALPLKNATPNLDKLAEEGTLFKNAYANNPVCNPSRASMWTGTYPHHHQCWNNHEGITEDIPTFRDRLETAGYQTKTIGPLDYTYGRHSIRDRVGSWTRAANIHRPLGSTSLPEIQEAGETHEYDRNHIQEGIDWLKNRNDDEDPFMLYLTTGLVHPAFNAAREFVDMIDESKIKIPPADQKKHPVLEYIKATKNANPDCPEHMIKKIRKVYYAMIATLDEMVGELLQSIKKLGLKEETYIIFSSDHGEMAMEHDQILKRTMYEPSIHVPLIVTGPGVEKNKVVNTPVSLVDLYPTLMDIAQRKHSEELVGESLLPICRGESNDHRDWVMAEYHGDRCNTGAFMLRKDEWKYIKYVGYRPQLFDLSEDPWEVNNLAADRPQLVAEMDELLSEIVDYEEIDARAKEYDKDNFNKWRNEQKERGTYEDMMAYIYSGYDQVLIDNIKEWSSEDEAKIKKWLEE